MNRSFALFRERGRGWLWLSSPKDAGSTLRWMHRHCFVANLFSALIVFFVVANSSALAQTTLTSGFWSYTVGTNNEAAIVGYSGPGGVIEIPGQIDGYTVKRLGDPNRLQSFLGSASSGVSSVAIPQGVEIISAQAFSGCSNLMSIDVPGSVVSIGRSAFSGCVNLTNIVLRPGLGFIGSLAFSSSDKLSQVQIPNTVLDIGQSAFHAKVELVSDDTALAVQESFWKALAQNEQFIGMLAEKIKSGSVPAGPKGDRGPAGPPGPRGPQGPPGRIWPFR
jgi:hypothetical protein